MSLKVLVAVQDSDVADRLADLLGKIELPDRTNPLIYTVYNEKNALQHLRAYADDPCSLVITHLGLAESANAARNDKDQRGFALLEALKRTDSHANAILISPIQEDGTGFSIFRRLRDFERPVPELVEDGKEDSLSQVIQKATDILSGIASSPVQRNRLVLTLSAERGHSYRLEAGGNLYAQGALVIEEEELSDIIDESKDAKDINQYPLWENLLRRIGRPLSKQIIETNVDLVRFLTELTGTTRTIEVCFDVSRDLHSAVLEALLEPAEASRPGWKSERERNFWMLKAPIYRRLFQGTGSTRSALFQVRNPPVVNCLVVESDVDGIVRTVRDSSGDPLSLRSLPNVRQEAEWLAQELPRIVGKSINVQRVNDEQARAEGLTLRELVMRTLTSGTEWHLIHYAGHCYFDARQAKAYLFFPNHPYIDALELGEFSTWLRDARFVYLSGCDSSEEEFVYELATNAVPAAFGFRWKIEDDLAIEFTKSFYKSLFLRTKSLEYALLEARREMRSLFKERRVWAAPLLMMQTNQNSTVAYSASGPQRLARAMTA